MDVTRHPFGQLPDGRAVERFDLTGDDIAMSVLDLGATIASIRLRDAAGEMHDIVLGFDDLMGWIDHPQFFGAIVGRYANRLRDGRFTVDGQPHAVTRNEGPNHLHGGVVGFDKVLWTGEPIRSPDEAGVVLRYTSAAGEEGYPGTLDVQVSYVLDAQRSILIDIEATTDTPTVVNLANHAYFDLSGTGSILDHEVAIHADRFLPIDDAKLPTGSILPVDGTPMDLRVPTRIADVIHNDDPQLRLAGGFDHCWVIQDPAGTLRPCATVSTHAMAMSVLTTQPGVQFYSGNAIRPCRGRGGATYAPHSGLCLETQHFPDSPNQPAFPSTVLRPGERFHERTLLRFDHG
jgi:aldose 1-epimerase